MSTTGNDAKMKHEHEHRIVGNTLFDSLLNRLPTEQRRMLVATRASRFWLLMKIILALGAVRIVGEGTLLVIPATGIGLIPGLREPKFAFVFAVFLVLGVMALWNQLIKYLLGMKRWDSRKEGIFIPLLAAIVILSDLALFYAGLVAWQWGSGAFSLAALLGTIAYMGVIVFVSWASVHAQKPVAVAGVLLACLLTFSACRNPEVSFGERDSEVVVTILVDLSGSFIDQIEHGEAYEFVTHVIDDYFRDTIGSRGRLIVAKISGEDRTVLLDADPLQVRKKFSSPEVFRSWLMSQGEGTGSKVHSAMIRSVEYMLTDPNVRAGKASCALVVVSDMLANSEETTQADVVDVLATHRVPTGLYFVDETAGPTWRDALAQAGIPHCVEIGAAHHPPLPRIR